MTDQQRLKLLNLTSKFATSRVRILDKYSERKNSLEPFCFQVEETGTNDKVYVSIVFGEILYYVTEKFIWDSAMDRGAPMPAKLRKEADEFILKQARNTSKDGEMRINIIRFPDQFELEAKNINPLLELIEEIENAN